MEPTAAYTIGRFQPPTLGHVRMIDAMLEKAKGAPTFVFISAVSEYIPPAMKEEYLRKMLTRNGVFPANLTLVDTSKCETPCGGPLGGFGYLKDRGMVGPEVLLFVGGDRITFDPKSAPMWSTIPAEERPTMQILPRVGEGAATFSSTDARKAVVTSGDLSMYLQDGTNALAQKDIDRMQSTLMKSLSKPAKKKGGADIDSVLDDELDGGRRRRHTRRARRTRKHKPRFVR